MKETIRIWGSGCPSVWGSWFSFDLLKSPASPESLLFVQSKIAKLLAVSFLVSWDFLVCHWPADRQEGDSDLLIRRGKYMKIHTRLTRTAYIQLYFICTTRAISDLQKTAASRCSLSKHKMTPVSLSQALYLWFMTHLDQRMWYLEPGDLDKK